MSTSFSCVKRVQKTSSFVALQTCAKFHFRITLVKYFFFGGVQGPLLCITWNEIKHANQSHSSRKK